MLNIGKSIKDGKDIICDIEFGNMLMVGCSGSGKTYLINRIIKQLNSRYENFIITDHPCDYSENLNIVDINSDEIDYKAINLKLDAIFNSEDKFIIVIDCSYLNEDTLELIYYYSRITRIKNKLMIVTCFEYNNLYENDKSRPYLYNCHSLIWFKTFHSEEVWLNLFYYNKDDVNKLRNLDNNTFMIDWKGNIEYAKA